MDLATLGAVGAPVLLFLSGVIGLMFKRSIDRQNARDAREKTSSELEAKRAQEVYDQMQEDLGAARGEVRSLQDDLGKARTELGQLWSQMTAMRRELDASEAHIAEWHRWADGGAQGPRPIRKAT